MRSISKLILLLLWSLVEVHSQNVPYISFMGETLPNHTYVDLTQVGDPEFLAVQCHTNLATCCSSSQGNDRGDWYFPNGDRLPFSGDGDIFELRRAQYVSINRRNNALSPSGIYRCDIPTDDVFDENDISVRDHIYAGVYATGGDITMTGDIGFTVDSDLNGPSPQFTLTCISTGGPATTVTWTRGSDTVTEGTETVLDDPVTAQYTHTLTGSTAGVYTCTVANDKPSNAALSVSLSEAPAPTNLTVTHESLTTIQLTWTPVSPLEDITGYIIYYSHGNITGSVNVINCSVCNYELDNIHAEVNYNISIVATSQHFPSNVIYFLIPPYITYANETATSVTLSWTSGGSEDVSYEVMWQRDTSVGCPYVDACGDSATITDGSTSYDITGLEEDSSYNITVRASNTAGSTAVGNTITVITLEAAPSAVPTSVSISAVSSFSITVQWGPVDCIHRNGDITGYYTCYEVSDASSSEKCVSSSSNASESVINGLEPSTKYIIRVTATNSVGNGSYSPSVTVETSQVTVEDIQVPLSGCFICTEWTMYLADEKLQEMTTAIISELRTSCKCEITAENFTNERLVCSSDSSNTVSYQAQIIGTSDTDITALVSLLEDWTASTPTISVLGALLRVGEECTVDVTDLSSGVCKKTNETQTRGTTPTDQLTDQTAQTDTSASDPCTDVSTAIGIAVAVGVGVVLVSGVTITVITVCIFKRKKHHQHSYSLKTSEELYSIPNPMHLDGTARPNVAYNITTRGGERDSDLDDSYDYIRTFSNPPRPHLVDNAYEIDTPENLRRIHVERQPQEAGERDTQNPPKET